MSRAREVVIPQSHIDAIIALPKPVEERNWRAVLLNGEVHGANRRATVALAVKIDFGPVRGELELYSRVNRTNLRDFSTGLVFRSLDGGTYQVIRCNGSSHIHTNRLHHTDAKIRYTPHVHTLREDYLEDKRADGDGYARATSAYDDLAGAIEHLASLTKLVPDERRLFL